MYSAYVFEAKSVQAYILTGGRLRDIVGGSALLDWMTSAEGEHTLLGPVKKKFSTASFPRTAGGAITVVFKGNDALSEARRFRALWRFQVSNAAPRLGFADGIGCEKNDREAIEKAQRNARIGVNIRAPELPQAIPLMAQSQRMAAPAAFVEGRITPDGICNITKERTDYATLAKRNFGNRPGNTAADHLGERLVAGNGDYRWPNEFDEEDSPLGSVIFPFIEDEDKEIAIIHADGDGIGAKIIKAMGCTDDAGAEIKTISETLTRATTKAAIAATKAVLLPAANTDAGVLAARPVLLGGDDLTMIIRADLALTFLTQYCREFEARTKELFAVLPDDHPFSEGVTASGAAVFFKARQPFSKALKLAEALSRHAKDKAPGNISFFRCTTSKIPVTMQEAWPGEGLTLGPYDAVGYDRLKALARVVNTEAIGRRGLRLALDAGRDLFKPGLERACKVMDARSGGSAPPSERLTVALSDMGADISGNPDLVKSALRDAFLLHRPGVKDAD